MAPPKGSNYPKRTTWAEMNGLPLERGYVHPEANAKILWMTVLNGMLCSWRAGSMVAKRFYDENFALLCELASLDPEEIRKQNGITGPWQPAPESKRSNQGDRTRYPSGYTRIQKKA